MAEEEPCCTWSGCEMMISKEGKGEFCFYHRGGHENPCLHEGCIKPQFTNACPRGYCHVHMANRDKVNQRNKESRERMEKRRRVLVERWERDSRLREKHLAAVSERQEGMCNSALKVSMYVNNGKPTVFCPWGTQPLPHCVRQLDHVTRVADGGSDNRSNLQMLCACCHAAKTAIENGTFDGEVLCGI